MLGVQGAVGAVRPTVLQAGGAPPEDGRSSEEGHETSGVGCSVGEVNKMGDFKEIQEEFQEIMAVLEAEVLWYRQEYDRKQVEVCEIVRRLEEIDALLDRGKNSE